MSEKRHRHQQRRQRRKATARARSEARADRELSALLGEMAASAAREAHEVTDALDAEQWASGLIGTWDVLPTPAEDVQSMFFPGFVDALERLGSARALATLRALAAIAAGEHAGRATAAADRLAVGGAAEPLWAAALGNARSTAAALVADETFDDGASVIVEFRGDGYETHTLGIYIDHNLGGLVKDVFVAGPLDEVRDAFGRRAPDAAGLLITNLELAEARARIEAALYMLDHTYDPPVNEDVRPARAMIDARMRLLPSGFQLPDDDRELTPERRDGLLAAFLAAPEGRRWRRDEYAQDVARLAIDFGADYNHGGPLRWSPVVVEIFMTSWLARKVDREPEFFNRVPDVLTDWVRYAGARRHVPEAALRDAVMAVEDYREEMLETVEDPTAWGPAKVFANAALAAGVDLTDPEQVDRFIARYNEGLAA
jgi:hypothetical protein